MGFRNQLLLHTEVTVRERERGLTPPPLTFPWGNAPSVILKRICFTYKGVLTLQRSPRTQATTLSETHQSLGHSLPSHRRFKHAFQACPTWCLTSFPSLLCRQESMLPKAGLICNGRLTQSSRDWRQVLQDSSNFEVQKIKVYSLTFSFSVTTLTGDLFYCLELKRAKIHTNHYTHPRPVNF